MFGFPLILPYCLCLSTHSANNVASLDSLYLLVTETYSSFSRNWFTNNSTAYGTNSTQLNPNIYIFMPNTAVPIYPTWQYNIVPQPATTSGETLEHDNLFRSVTGNQTFTEASNGTTSTTQRSWTTSQGQILDVDRDLMPVSLRPRPRGLNVSEETSGYVEPGAQKSAESFKIPSLSPFMFVPNYPTRSKSKVPLPNELNSSTTSSSTASSTSGSTSGLKGEHLRIGGNPI